MAAALKEVGLVTFLRDYLRRGDGNEIPSLRKLILGFGIIPVSDHSPFSHYCGCGIESGSHSSQLTISQYPFDTPQPRTWHYSHSQN
jgi:hypothetical protein